MGIFVSGKGHFTPAPEGLFAAVCVDVVDLGLKDTPWGAKQKIKLVWEIDELMDDGRRFIVQKQYTASLHEKATLHKDLKAWRGRPFTPSEISNFDVEVVLAAPCKLLIQHDEKDGSTYANIAAIMKADALKRLQPSGTYVRVKDRTDGMANDSRDPNGFGDGSPVPVDDDLIPF